MKKTITYAFAYLVQEDDHDEFTRLLRPTFKNIDSLKPQDDRLLERIDASLLTPYQTLLLASYLCLYCSFYPNEEKLLKRLLACLQQLQVNNSFLTHAKRMLQTLSEEQLKAHGTPVRCVFDPPQPVIDFVNTVVYTAEKAGGVLQKQLVKELSSREYEHRWDLQALNALEKTPGFEKLVRTLMKHGLEPAIRIRYTGSNIRVTEKMLPAAYSALREACEILYLSRPPELYIEQGFINGMTVGAEEPLIVLSAGSLGLLSHDELLFLVGHEIGHIKSQHMLYHTMSAVLPVLGDLIGSLTLGLGGGVALGVQLALMNWYRMSEFTADRAGLLCCQNLDAATNCLMKIAGMPPSLYKTMKADHFREQAKHFDNSTANTRDKIVRILSVMDASHPWTVQRAQELQKWYDSGEYEKVLNRETQIPAEEICPPQGQAKLPGGVAVAQVARYCTECGTVRTQTAVFCTGCGNKF